jgi:membrane protease YdiL (CAAX protease family)
MHLPIPARPVMTGFDGWLTWLVYQFLYVAVAEEVFFQGYVQTNVMRCLGNAHPGRQYLAMLISAGCFALAHVVVQGQVASALTFLPGVILAWLLIRTRSLLAPILFHGLANVSYGVIALAMSSSRMYMTSTAP